jgi:alkylation response protein AidB-like acyl-CoA dehydrogenase
MRAVIPAPTSLVCSFAQTDPVLVRRPGDPGDARVTTLYEGTSQIEKLIIGRATTGINALVT